MNSSTVGLGITRLGQVAINAQNIDRAAAFYRDRLGLLLLFRTDKLAFFDCAACV